MVRSRNITRTAVALLAVALLGASPGEADETGGGRTCAGSDYMTGLVARWKLTDGSGTTAADSSGNGLTATLNNGAKWDTTDGYPSGGNTLFLTAANAGYLSVDNNSKLNFGSNTSITITAWINWSGNLNTLPAIILSKGSNTSENDANYMLWINNSGVNVFFGFYSNGTDEEFEGPQLTGGWHFIAYKQTFGTASTAAFYINGVPQPANATAGAGTPHTSQPTANTRALWIGSNKPPGGQQYYSGMMNDLRIYNSYLTDAQVQQIYNYTRRGCP
jgi:hypothetical protein